MDATIECQQFGCKEQAIERSRFCRQHTQLAAAQGIVVARGVGTTTVHDKLTAMGWTFGETGGGCTAYSKPTKDPSVLGGRREGWYWLMTDSMDPVAPKESDQHVTVGLYDNDGGQVISLTVDISLILTGKLVFEDSYA